MSSAVELFLDAKRGVYIPRDFAMIIDKNQWRGIDDNQLSILLGGPDASWYWETWTNILDDAELISDGRRLHQDGDLWLIDFEGDENELRQFFGDHD